MCGVVHHEELSVRSVRHQPHPLGLARRPGLGGIQQAKGKDDRLAGQIHLSSANRTTYANNTLANIEKGPTFHMDEAVGQEGPTRRRVLVQGLGLAETEDPASAVLGARGVARSVAPSVRSAETFEAIVAIHPPTMDNDVSLSGACRDRSLII